MNKKILIIDDDNLVVKALIDYFGRKGYYVDSASDGKEGILKAKQSKPDIILLDIVLPVMDGFSVLKQLKEDPETKSTLIIMLTNLETDASTMQIIKEGKLEYLVKAEYTLENLLRKIEEIYELHLKENK